ncbi:Phage repressor protein C, contains Cro/C1-type HTH and peptisase s24 domains [Sphingomonas laterariae]|uniref:Phage repressor protein C, contains Cro/C1-type HTH and peptisase s24 domains n=1 Tax=Edaphosphingomonas laterariae TaxID=861865 RepID=A0A239H1G2_9SPHN|nr:S24 family peptidase [Sphingomonas laterariae]SNS75011.1 Phage repressor protein C, contains Cro/C1-type HTH and peptisase s24 domains [Sphingomonas laterariae]
MADADPRATLEALVRERGEDYASLSRMLGRNPAYIQQFIKRGTPRKLDEADRAALARYFGVDEALLGGPARPAGPRVATAERGGSRRTSEFVAVPRLAVRASAGPGTLDAELSEDRRGDRRFAFDAGWLRALAPGGPVGLSLIRVEGDSMLPTLADGDDILVDRGDGADRLRDGVYVLRVDDVLLVKRLLIQPADRRVTVASDNPAYPPLADCDPHDIHIVGRVVWGGRRFR